MPTAVFCIYDSGHLSVGEPVEFRRRANRGVKLLFYCEECGSLVRPHKAECTGQAAHFEHNNRNPPERAQRPPQ